MRKSVNVAHLVSPVPLKQVAAALQGSNSNHFDDSRGLPWSAYIAQDFVRAGWPICFRGRKLLKHLVDVTKHAL